MKKVIIALVIAMIIPCCVFAGRGMFDLTVGVAAQSTYDIEDVQAAAEAGTAEGFSIDGLAFGADVEAKLSILAIDAKGPVPFAFHAFGRKEIIPSCPDTPADNGVIIHIIPDVIAEPIAGVGFQFAVQCMCKLNNGGTADGGIGGIEHGVHDPLPGAPAAGSGKTGDHSDH